MSCLFAFASTSYGIRYDIIIIMLVPSSVGGGGKRPCILLFVRSHLMRNTVRTCDNDWYTNAYNIVSLFFYYVRSCAEKPA